VRLCSLAVWVGRTLVWEAPRGRCALLRTAFAGEVCTVAHGFRRRGVHCCALFEQRCPRARAPAFDGYMPVRPVVGVLSYTLLHSASEHCAQHRACQGTHQEQGHHFPQCAHSNTLLTPLPPLSRCPSVDHRTHATCDDQRLRGHAGMRSACCWSCCAQPPWAGPARCWRSSSGREAWQSSCARRHSARTTCTAGWQCGSPNASSRSRSIYNARAASTCLWAQQPQQQPQQATVAARSAQQPPQQP
jgi:hypothetical protein